MKLWMLGSGSNGNAILIDCDGSRLLIDCGFGTRTLATRLAAIRVDPRSIEGCLVTHEHGDHAMGAAAAARRWGWRLYATPGTAGALNLARSAVHRFQPNAALEFPRMTVASTPTPHDATQSVGFVVTSRSTGARAGLFYDLGHVSRAIVDACDALDVLIIESNYDDPMLRAGPYPPSVQARIASRVGHLSNRQAGVFVRAVVPRTLSHLVLAHLSENCNTPQLALTSMRSALAGTRFRGTLTAANQDAVSGPFSATRSAKVTQYSLF